VPTGSAGTRLWNTIEAALYGPVVDPQKKANCAEDLPVRNVRVKPHQLVAQLRDSVPILGEPESPRYLFPCMIILDEQI
jgi:hypothetical protein